MMTRGIGWAFGIMLALETAALAQEHETLGITVRLRNDAGMSDSVVGMARTAVASVFSAAGVQLTFVTRTPHLTIVLLSADGGRRMHQIAEAIGLCAIQRREGWPHHLRAE